MKKILTLLILLLLVSISFSQEVRLEKAILSNNNPQSGPTWATDVVVSAFEPIGPIAAAQLGGNIYVAVNDTLATANLGLIIYKSTNTGLTWVLNSVGITYRGKIDRIVFVTTGLGPDSLNLFFMAENTVYRWNVVTNSFNQVLLTGNYRTFDVTGSSTGALYIFLDVLTSNSIPRNASTDGGFTWPISATVTSSGAIPRVTPMIGGDSTILNYYNTATIVGGDTTTAAIRSARYRQTANGTISSLNFLDAATETVPKHEYKSAKINNNIWLMYTTGTTGNIDILGRKSDNSGVSYGSPVNVATNPNVDEYWFDIKVYTGAPTGFDFIYYSDSLQSGAPTNNTDKLMYTYATSTMTSFAAPVQVSQHPPGWSAAGYVPVIASLPPLDLGAVWVGLDGTAKKVYWDRYDLVSKLKNQNNEIPAQYSLSQNYPNPFNPATKIQFEIPKSGFVSLKVYDMLGREVSDIVSQNLTAGTYIVDFDGTQLTSGVYFYKITAGNFSETRKMLLVK